VLGYRVPCWQAYSRRRGEAVNTKGDFGSGSRWSRGGARSSSPRIGCVLGVPCLARRACRVAVLKTTSPRAKAHQFRRRGARHLRPPVSPMVERAGLQAKLPFKPPVRRAGRPGAPSKSDALSP
jgi:hypothetical protein